MTMLAGPIPAAAGVGIRVVIGPDVTSPLQLLDGSLRQVAGMDIPSRLWRSLRNAA